MYLQKVLFDVGIFRKSLKTASWWHIPLKIRLTTEVLSSLARIQEYFLIPSQDSGIFSHP